MSVRRERFVTTRQFLETARSYDIDTEECILEALDNSFDASANEISINVSFENERIRIMIVDNGVGIPTTHIDENNITHQGIPYVLAYGGRIPHPGKTTIGKFGWGLSQAASSLSSRTEIFSKTINDSDWRFGYYDFKELENSENCELEPEVSSMPPTIDIHETGTVVIFYMDRSEYKSINGVVKMIQKNLGRVYRKFIQNGAKISISFPSGKKMEIEEITINDPIHQIPGSKQVSMFGTSKGPFTHTIPLDGRNSLGAYIDPNTGKYAEIIVHICLLDIQNIRNKLGITGSGAGRKLSQWGIGNEHQGFSIMRNGREIRRSETLGLWTKGRPHQYIRGEIEFPEILDKLFNVQVNKSRFTINSSLRNIIDNECNRTIRSLVKESRNNATKRNLQNKKKQTPPAELIVGMMKDYIPKVELTKQEKQDGEVRKKEKIQAIIAKAENEGDQKILSAKENLLEAKESRDSERITYAEESVKIAIADKKSSVKQIRNRFEFDSPIRKEFGVLGSGDMYAIEHLGEEVWITMNTDTPFFRLVYEKALMKPEEESLLDLMIFAMAWAEHMKRNEPSIKQFWEEARPVVSQNAHLFCSYMRLEDES